MKHIDRVFKEKLANQEASVPEGLWEKIAPEIQEKSRRGLLWFWIVGIIALMMISGILWYTTDSTNNTTATTQPLSQAIEQGVSTSENTSTAISSVTNTENKDLMQSEEHSTKVEDSQTSTSNTTASVATTLETSINKTNTTTANQQVKTYANTNQAANIEASLEDDIMKYAKPANLVITKSVISDSGSIIKKSNFNDTQGKTPAYNVFINSNGLGAGATRLVEPLGGLPLPAFENGLKKKTIK